MLALLAPCCKIDFPCTLLSWQPAKTYQKINESHYIDPSIHNTFHILYWWLRKSLIQCKKLTVIKTNTHHDHKDIWFWCYQKSNIIMSFKHVDCIARVTWKDCLFTKDAGALLKKVAGKQNKEVIIEVILYTHCNFKMTFKDRWLFKIYGHSLFVLYLCLFTLVCLFKTRTSTNMNNLGAAIHFWYGNSSSMDCLMVWMVF